MIQTVYHWLKAMPGLEQLQREQLAAASGSAGLFCKGLKELSRTQDILGTTRIRQSLSFVLSLHSTCRETPEIFLHLNTAGAPVLGEDQRIFIGQGRLVRDGGTGISRFEATIIFTFTSEG